LQQVAEWDFSVHHVLMRWLADRYLRWRGWVWVGERPQFPKFVAIAAPHTTNWDFVVFLAVARHFDIPARVVAKHSLVRWPLGWLMRRLGVIPVRRHRSEGLVDQMVAEYEASDRMALVIAPEGTRSRAPFWRSGFYHIARAVSVPLVMTFLDYENKRAGVGGVVHLTGNVTADMRHIRQFYTGINGKRPENQGPIAIREEATSA
jgi:1-acyl-sn-glycerol-3-phosphate acyltransferase